MDEEEELQESELKNVSGGKNIYPDLSQCTCKKCGEKYFKENVECRFVRKGCSTMTFMEAKCPRCGTWNY